MVRVDEDLFASVVSHLCRLALYHIQAMQADWKNKAHAHEMVLWFHPFESKSTAQFTDIRTMVLTVVDTGCAILRVADRVSCKHIAQRSLHCVPTDGHTVFVVPRES